MQLLFLATEEEFLRHNLGIVVPMDATPQTRNCHDYLTISMRNISITCSLVASLGLPG